MDWLDTETKALLQHTPPEKFATPDTAGYTLVLLALPDAGGDAVTEAVQRAANVLTHEAERILSHPLPTPVKKGLFYPAAQIGQFELICCDAVSVIIADEVVAEAPASYLRDLYRKLRKSDEFELVTVRIGSIPATQSGRDFRDRFLGGREPPASGVVQLMRKKARIIQHWAAKIGVHVVSNCKAGE